MGTFNILYLFLFFVVITLVAIFLATREKDDLMDQDEKIPTGKGKTIDTSDKVYELESASSKDLKKIVKHKSIDYKKIDKAKPRG